jgi:hypothetical protein
MAAEQLALSHSQSRMSPRKPDPIRPDDKWLEKSLVSPSVPLLYERSDDEKWAGAELIHEKAKTEWWNREITRLLFTVRVVLVVAPLSFGLGVLVGIWSVGPR